MFPPQMFNDFMGRVQLPIQQGKYGQQPYAKPVVNSPLGQPIQSQGVGIEQPPQPYMGGFAGMMNNGFMPQPQQQPQMMNNWMQFNPFGMQQVLSRQNQWRMM